MGESAKHSGGGSGAPAAFREADPKDVQSGEGAASTPVFLVGAGPGPLDLLTVKALRLLQQADVVIHDHLVGSEVLAAVRPGAELIFVGKRGGHFCRPQAEIETLLIQHGRRPGKLVVRLKGGDPLIFGRGGEEAAALTAAGLAYEIVPGVTAALAAGAYSGIPLTHRAHSSAVVFLTGHEDPEKSDAGVKWEDYGRLKATLCVYMGVRNLGSILGRLQAGGMSADLPAALVQSAASARQRVLVATVGTLAERAAAEDFAAPALAIIGSVVAAAPVAAAPVAAAPVAAAPVAAAARRFQVEKSGEPPLPRPIRFALIDNGSLAAASYLNLRRVASELSQLTGLEIDAVSWKHSDRIPPDELAGERAWTAASWYRHHRERGIAEFTFVPFFISPQGAIGSALREDLEALQREHGGVFAFTEGLQAAIPAIVADRVREIIAELRAGRSGVPAASLPAGDAASPNMLFSEVVAAAAAAAESKSGGDAASTPSRSALPPRGSGALAASNDPGVCLPESGGDAASTPSRSALRPRGSGALAASNDPRVRLPESGGGAASTNTAAPQVIVVDHGGPSPLTAQLRNQLTAQVATLLGSEVALVTAASMESPEGAEFAFNRPLLSDALRAATGPVIIAPLFLSPGRHAGPAGDLAQITGAAEATDRNLHCHFSGLVGTHPLAVAALAASLEPFIFRKLASVQP